jgi:hypothetical protein
LVQERHKQQCPTSLHGRVVGYVWEHFCEIFGFPDSLRDFLVCSIKIRRFRASSALLQLHAMSNENDVGSDFVCQLSRGYLIDEDVIQCTAAGLHLLQCFFFPLSSSSIFVWFSAMTIRLAKIRHHLFSRSSRQLTNGTNNFDWLNLTRPSPVSVHDD